jgi:uncharacterized SAM-binding protein YcdF (DUF218 family)
MTRRFWWRLLAGLVAIAIAECGWTCWRIIHQANAQELRPASAIVVFGAAEYAGRPSPVYRARLDHAFDLYSQRFAPWVITTGGAGGDPSFSEGGVGAEYLAHRGIPEASLIPETQGTDTAQSALRVARILHTSGFRDCIAVSDAYHVFRIKRMLETNGITVYTAPRPNSLPRTRAQRTGAVLREAGSYFLWQMHIT